MGSQFVWSLLLFSAVLIFAINVATTLKCDTTVDASTTATVACPLTGNIKWTKGGNDVVTKEHAYTISTENRTLSVIKIDKDRSGEYVCSNGDNNSTLTICVNPYIQPYDKPKNVIEGDPFQSECSAWGYPPLTFEWTHEKNFSGSEDRVTYKNSTNGMNAILRIDNMKYEDSGEYTCTVTNVLGSKNATIQVNVKDKLAALWPFLGICAEVAILCTIIFLYERSRAKRLEKEAAQAEETDHMTANNDTKVSDDVRHRK